MTTTQKTNSKAAKMIELHNSFVNSYLLEIEAENATTKVLDGILKDGIKPTEYYINLFEAGYVLPAKDVKGKKQVWPTTTKGDKKSATSNDTRKAVLEVNRLVSAYDVRLRRSKIKADKLAIKNLKALLGGKLPEYVSAKNVDDVTKFVVGLEIPETIEDKVAFPLQALESEFAPVTIIPEVEETDSKPASEKSASDKPDSAPRVDTNDDIGAFDLTDQISSLQALMSYAATGGNIEPKLAGKIHKAAKGLFDLIQEIE